jgi:hypothetical protein
VAGQLDVGAELRSAERGLHLQVASPAVVAEIFDREGEAVDLDAIESLQSRERQLLVGRGEVEVGREATRVAGPKLPQRGAALKYQSVVEQPGGVEQVQRVVLRNIQQRRIASALDALVVAHKVSLCNPGHDPVPTLKYG